MSFIIRRQLSTLIPPKIASAKNIGSNPAAKRLASVVEFYKALPQGPAPQVKPTGLIGRYKEKYFNGDNATGKPLLHLSAFVLIFGYSLEYYFHLRHHKDGAEHH
ncbi:CYFA0S01e09780g1_1 [Cyberlindnera fabianii]|uniref:ATP synthase subunit f, mitochondrial n=1 Tax=Cyberlindnera fabianii TaxID=36022 RepID=A0A061AIF0_CYBFA|nr:ATP synthase subunit f, mitochondrial [Cyberlindnera fabianii]CDR37340.1 CYFA0S01e09780g1_1 [Cyberlindnera fabianii]